MLLILLNWVLIFYVSFVIGSWLRAFFAPGNADVALSVIWGLFGISQLCTFALFFLPGNLLLLPIVFFAAIIHGVKRGEVHLQWRNFAGRLSNKQFAIALAVLILCLLILSAQASRINDDGYYYRQTMRWFSEVGFVNGISNLMLPLGLGSSWHILQSVFNLDFLHGIRLNDINGLTVVLAFLFFAGNDSPTRSNALRFLLLSFVLLISVPFLSAPSPDLPVIVFTSIGFFLALQNPGKKGIADIVMLAAFAVTIKLSAVGLAVVAFVLVCYSMVRRDKLSPRIYFLIACPCLLLVSKNLVQTGYPLYPYAWLGGHGFDWTTPSELLRYYAVEIKSWGLTSKIYRGPLAEWRDPGIGETISRLWSHAGFKGMINKMLLSLFAFVSLAMIVDVFRRRTDGLSFTRCVLYFIFVINVWLWLEFAPQYRFILPVVVFYLSWFISRYLEFLQVKTAKLQVLPLLAILIIFLVSIFPISLEIESTSPHIGRTEGLQSGYMFKPHVRPAPGTIDTLRIGGQDYYHLRGSRYCWDSPIPCMSGHDYRNLSQSGYFLKFDGRRKFVLLRH